MLKPRLHLITTNIRLNIFPANLLYTEKGMEEAAKIWKEFEAARDAHEGLGNEDKEEEDREDAWGMGELEDEEYRRRDRNGEYELAARGWGE